MIKKKANTLLFSYKISEWYLNNKRDLPWRASPTPYSIWLSEVILQQTRINQGLSYYHRFIDKYPTVNDLANAKEEEVLKLWQGLGYYSRARNMLEGARQIIQTYKGKIPDNYNDLLKIKGVGEYTAAAIASIAYNQAVATVDGNVSRVMARYFGIPEAINTTPGKKKVKKKADSVITSKDPGTHNQAVMELGALVCKAQNPDCHHCPLASECFAFNKQLTDSLPHKIRKTNKKERYFYYFIIKNKNHVVFLKRTKNDIWKNMYDFPCIEKAHPLTIKELPEDGDWQTIFHDTKVNIEKVSKEYLHILTHQRIYATFLHIEIDDLNALPSPFLIVNKKEAEGLPIPKLIENYINSTKLFNVEV